MFSPQPVSYRSDLDRSNVVAGIFGVFVPTFVGPIDGVRRFAPQPGIVGQVVVAVVSIHGLGG